MLLLGLACPYSTAATSLALALLLALLAMRPRMLRSGAVWTDPVVCSGLLLFAIVCVNVAWTSGWTRESAQAANHYHELLFAPALVLMLRERSHRAAFWAGLLASVTLLSLAYWLVRIAPAALPRLQQDLSGHRISASFALATTAFLLYVRSCESARPWLARLLAAWLAATVLVAMDGRTGQAILLALCPLAFWLCAKPGMRARNALASLVVVVGLAAISPGVKSRLQETFHGQVRSASGELTSTAIRVELVRLSGDLARLYWPTGAGYPNFAQVHWIAAQDRYAHDPQRRDYLLQPWARISNPHNEYVVHLVGGGVLALAAFLAWLGLTLRRGLRLPGAGGGMLIGLVTAFALGCLFNSMLKDFIEGHFYIAVLAALLGRAVAAGAAPAGEQPPQAPAVQASDSA